MAAWLLALLAACQTTPQAPATPGTVTHIPPGNAERDGPDANPPPNLDAVPDAVPQIEPIRTGGPNKPYEIAGHTYVPLTDDRAVTEKGLASWYGKKFHGHRTASGEAYNMYAMTAAHKTLPIPSYARVRNPANGHEVIVRVNDRGPFSAGRVIDLSYTAALKLGVLGGVQQVEITRITADDIRSGAAFNRGTTVATATPAAATGTIGELDRPTAAPAPPAEKRGGGLFFWRRKPAAAASAAAGDGVVTAVASGAPTVLPPAPGDVVAAPVAGPGAAPVPADAARGAAGLGSGVSGGVDLGAAAAADTAPAVPGTSVVTTVTTQAAGGVPGSGAAVAAGATPAGAAASQPIPAGVVLPPPAGGSVVTPVGSPPPSPGAITGARSAVPAVAPAAVSPPSSPPMPTPPRAEPHDEHGHAETAAGAGWYVQIGAYKQREGALDFQHRLVDEQPWLAPLLAVVTDHGLNKLQAGPYRSREDAKAAAERVRSALQLVPTIVEKH